MTILSDVAAVERRIAQIAGAPVKPQGDFSALVTGAVESAPSNHATPLAPTRIERLISSHARTAGVDAALIKAIVANESGFNPNATSSTNARGLMQLEPATAAGLGVVDSYDPEQNILGGTRYVKALLQRFGGDVRLAVAAYNAGPGAVERYGGVPPYAETQRYVVNVLDSYRKYKAKLQ